MKSEGLEQGATVLLAASPRDARRCAGNQMSIVRARGRFRRAGCDRRRARRARSPGLGRSEERREGKECVGTWRSRWSPDHPKKKKVSTYIFTPTSSGSDSALINTKKQLQAD